MSSDAECVTAEIRKLIEGAGGADRLIVPRGYPHLGLSIVDSVFSLRAHYDTTVLPVLRRYCERADGISWDERFDETIREHGTSGLLSTLSPLDSNERCELLNRQVAPGTSKRKADVCVELASLLKKLDIEGHRDLATAVRSSSEVEREIRNIGGLGPAAWRYLLNLSRVEVSKPDTMVVRWIQKVIGSKPTQKQAAEQIQAAVDMLQGCGISVSVRSIDHLVWRAASERPLAG